MSNFQRNSIQILILHVFALIAVVNVSCGQSQANTDSNNAMSINNQEADTDLFYKVSTRWANSTITKEELLQVKTFFDLVPQGENEIGKEFKNIRIIVMESDRDFRTTELGSSVELNESQLELLHNSDYSTNLLITAINRKMNVEAGVFVEDSVLRYMTIVPEFEAEFHGGNAAIIDYLKESSKKKVAIIDKDNVQPCKVHFTVLKDGSIGNVYITWTCGYPSVDEELMKIVSNMPQQWTPARNAKGEKVDQEFVFFFGIEGC